MFRIGYFCSGMVCIPYNAVPRAQAGMGSKTQPKIIMDTAGIEGCNILNLECSATGFSHKSLAQIGYNSVTLSLIWLVGLGREGGGGGLLKK